MRAQFLLFLTFISFSASAKTYTDPTYNVVYTLNESAKTATVAAENASLHKSNASAIVIPATITDTDGTEYTVMSIVDGAFKGTAITSIDIQIPIKSIPSSFFEGCKNLVEVKYPDSVTSIGRSAFLGCVSLHCPNLSNITSIDYFAFENCTSLGVVSLPSKISIKGYAFRYSTISNIIFSDADDSEIDIDGITGNSFGWVSGLEKIKFPKYIKIIPFRTFFQCPDLKEVDLSDCGEELIVGSCAFYENKSLEKVIFPKKIKEIKESAFQETAIKSIQLPEMESLGENAFFGTSLEKINLDSWPVNPILNWGNNIFGSNNSLTSVVMPAWMSTIPNKMFFECTNLSSVGLNNGLISIGSQSFYKCNISNIELPSSLKSIDSDAFSFNIITSIDFPEGIENIGGFGNNQLTSISIPKSVKQILSNAFCSNLINSIEFPESQNASFTPINIASGVFAINEMKEFCFPAWMTTIPEGFLRENNLTSVTLASGTDIIKANAFRSNYKLQIGKFPDSIKLYGDSCFSSCGSKLTGDNYLGIIHIGNGVEIADNAFENARLKEVIFDDCNNSLGENVFSGVTSVEKISFPECMTAIPAGICKGWTKLTEVKWPPIIEEIGANAFYGCTNLNFTPTIDGYDKGGFNNILDLTQRPFNNHGEEGKSLKLGEGCFGATSIDKVIWPNENIGLTIEGLFKDCKTLNNVNIPVWMETIPNSMFQGCTGLSNIIWDISRSDMNWAESKYQTKDNYSLEIGEYAFSNTGMSTISWPEVSTSLKSYAFYNNLLATKIEWPESTAILNGTHIFSSCKALSESTTVPIYITSIPNQTFSKCNSLPEFTIPETVTELGTGVFESCSNLEYVYFNSHITELPASLFIGCKKLRKFTAYHPITTIGTLCFNYCSSLEEISLSNGDTNLSNIGIRAFWECPSLKGIPYIDGMTSLGEYCILGTNSIKSIKLPSNPGRYIRDSMVLDANIGSGSSLQVIDFLANIDNQLVLNNTNFGSSPLLGVSTYYSYPKGVWPFNGANNRVNKGILLVNRNMKPTLVEKGYGKLWNIVEAKQPKLELQGALKSEFTPGETVNHYTATLLWEICESDLDQAKPTQYELYRDGSLRAKVTIGTAQTLDAVHEDNIQIDEAVTAHPVSIKIIDAEGKESDLDMSKYADGFTYQTGENNFTEIYANQHSYLYFNPKTSHRLGLNEKMGAKSWFIFVDEFDSPDLNGLDVPSCYSYTVKMKGYDYQEPRNNPGYEAGKDGNYWHLEDFTLEDVVSEPCLVYTSMAVPSLTFGGTYTHDEILADTDGSLSVTKPIDENGDVSVTYAFADQSHVLHKLDSKPIIDHITSYEIGVSDTERSTDGYSVWETINIKGNTSKASGEMIVPKSKNPGVGSSFQLVTHTEGRGDFGSRVVTIPGAPTLDIELEKTMIYGSEAEHGHNTVIRNDIILNPDVTAMKFPSAIPPASHHVIGVWRTIDRQVIANAPRRAGEESSDPSTSPEILIHHNGSDVVEHTWDCPACQAAQGYAPGDDKCIYTDHVVAEHSQASLSTNYRVRMYVRTPYDENQWMIAEAQANRDEVLTDIRNVGIDSDTPIYFNLQGMRVMQPRHGEILIRVDRTGSHRIRYSEE